MSFPTSVQSSDQLAYGDTRSDTRGNAVANIGLVNANIGRGNALSAAASAGAALPPWVWVAVAGLVVGGAAWVMLKKK